MHHTEWTATQNVKKSLQDSADVREPILGALRDVEGARQAPPVPETSPKPHDIREGFVDINTQVFSPVPVGTPAPDASTPTSITNERSLSLVHRPPESASIPAERPLNPPPPPSYPPLPPQPQWHSYDGRRWDLMLPGSSYSQYFWPSTAANAQPHSQPPVELVIGQQRVAQADANRQPVDLGSAGQRVPRHCAKCGKPQKECKGAQNRRYCLNPCQFCQRRDCSGKNTAVRGSKCPNAT